jgi:prepilin-type N-terminal cleavage/methylation domain-containing protein
MTGRQDSSAGFTLVEMIAVLAILGVLAVLVYPNLVRFKDQQLTRSGVTQVGGVLDDARARASTEAVPYLVFFNDRNAGGNGCGSAATVVRDADRSYSITAGDDVRDVEFEYSVCRVARPFGDPTTVVDSSIPLPTQDLAVRAIGGVGGIVGGLVGGLGGIVGGLVGGGGGGGGGAAPAMLADTVVYGSTFPIDPASGRPVVAFSERGIPVDPQTPTQWGSGAGAMYVTDGRETVYAALVQPLGDVQLRVYDRVAGDWR